jgi:hypothetical protein
MQRSSPALVLGWCDRAVLEKGLCEFDICPVQCQSSGVYPSLHPGGDCAVCKKDGRAVTLAEAGGALGQQT